MSRHARCGFAASALPTCCSRFARTGLRMCQERTSASASASWSEAPFTRTVKTLGCAVLPRASVAVQLTVVSPIGNTRRARMRAARVDVRTGRVGREHRVAHDGPGGRSRGDDDRARRNCDGRRREIRARGRCRRRVVGGVAGGVAGRRSRSGVGERRDVHLEARASPRFPRVVGRAAGDGRRADRERRPDGIEQAGVTEPSTRSVALAAKLTGAPAGEVARRRSSRARCSAGGVVSLTDDHEGRVADVAARVGRGALDRRRTYRERLARAPASRKRRPCRGRSTQPDTGRPCRGLSPRRRDWSR